MGIKVPPELSEKNQYWISRHRYYELKHFCMQYYDWKKQRIALMETLTHANRTDQRFERGGVGDPTGNASVELDRLESKIHMLEICAERTDPILGEYILLGVTKGMPYDAIKARLNIPCCREMYYNLYRRFFWILDKARN